MRRALQRLKYGGASRLAGPLAAAALPRLRLLLRVSGAVPLIPVPVHLERRRQRGYNQAELLARAIGETAGLPVVQPLVRARATTMQHRLDRAGRLHNLRGAFGAARGARAPPVAILVDDILTTSATLEACASVLIESGAERVYGFAIGREV
ncbi:MAG: ComF family protein [Candidatus Limnocylindria bacterium]